MCSLSITELFHIIINMNRRNKRTTETSVHKQSTIYIHSCPKMKGYTVRFQFYTFCWIPTETLDELFFNL